MQNLELSGSVPQALALRRPSAFYFASRRMLDVVLSTIALILSMPILIVACIAIIIETPGLPIFCQLRVGAHGKSFKILKFRTMRVMTEHFSCVTTSHDPRITRVGAFLRATKIDELPQLINILRGEMSIIGPRPLSREECNRIRCLGFHEDTPGFVPTVLPGLIGLEQINRDRQLGYAERFRLNAIYEAGLCLQLDFEILCRALIPCRAVIYSLVLGLIGELAILAALPSKNLF